MATAQPLAVPAQLAGDTSFCKKLAATLDESTRRPLPADFSLPAAACLSLLKRVEKLLAKEPTVVHVSCDQERASCARRLPN